MKKWATFFPIFLILCILHACTDGFMPGWQQYVPTVPGPERAVPRSTSLFVATDRHESGEGNNLASLLRTAVDGSRVKPEMVILGGDYVGHGGGGNPAFPISDLYDEIDSTLAPPFRDVVITYGSHDINCTDGYEAFFSGPRRCDGYYVYGISFAQMIYPTDAAVLEAIALYQEQHEGQEAGAQEQPDGERPPGPPAGPRGYNGLDIHDRYGLSAESASGNFLSWVHSLPDNNPIVVMSHVPLHANRRDNLGATVWYQALSEAARQHDVVFLWGHNHSLEESALRQQEEENDGKRPPGGNLNDRYSYLLTPGERITLQGPADSLTVDGRLDFTYVNAGYLKLGYASVITFSGHARGRGYDRMTIRRFALDPDATEEGFGYTEHRNPFTMNLRRGADPSRR